MPQDHKVKFHAAGREYEATIEQVGGTWTASVQGLRRILTGSARKLPEAVAKVQSEIEKLAKRKKS